MKNLTIFSLVLCFSALFFSCKPDGVTTPHGFRFVNHTNKPGPKATYEQNVMLHVITLMGDSVLQSTYKTPGSPVAQQIPDSARLATAKVFPPVFEALMFMAEGDSATIYQPVDTILEKYIPENLKKTVKEITYKVVLVSVETTEMKANKAAAATALQTQLTTAIADFRDGKLAGKLATTTNKVQVMILEAGAGPKVAANEQVSVDYIGARINDGVKFDESYSRGQTLDFVAGAGQMIPGFDEAVQTMTHGTKAIIFIPYAQAYGDAGAGADIPAKTDIAFYIDLK
jgi:FKBP-type peptidyl-prolyl cis-trans isomerase FkpA